MKSETFAGNSGGYLTPEFILMYLSVDGGTSLEPWDGTGKRLSVIGEYQIS